MNRYSLLLGYFEKQIPLIDKLFFQVADLDLSSYEKRYVFALKVQQFYTAIEDLMKQTAKSFENHIEDLSSYHKEILLRLNTSIPKVRPALISDKIFPFLDKLRGFRHFIRHAYDVELNEGELVAIQRGLKENFPLLKRELEIFVHFVEHLLE